MMIGTWQSEIVRPAVVVLVLVVVGIWIVLPVSPATCAPRGQTLAKVSRVGHRVSRPPLGGDSSRCPTPSLNPSPNRPRAAAPMEARGQNHQDLEGCGTDPFFADFKMMLKVKVLMPFSGGSHV